VREVWLILLVNASALTFIFTGVLVWGVVYHRSLRAALGTSGGSWCAALVLFFGMLALVSAAPLLGQQEGRWRYLPLAAINRLIQPLCGLLIFAAGHQLVMGLTGRLTYRLRVVSPEAFDPETYRQLVHHRTVSGLFGLAFSGGMSGVCLWPLLSVV
jgi:hypothetical protein